MTGPVAVVRAPAKLTVELRITGVRDDGYHLIDAEMVTLDLADTLTIRPGASGVTYRGPFADGLVGDGHDLVSRALAAVGRTAAVDVVKEIPHGGGLGGGSADAAAVLRWAGVTDPAVAVSIGADVAFCVVGGRARVRGIGEVVDPLPTEPRTFTLIVPPFGVSTPAAYRAWDALGGPTGSGRNDLEAGAIAAEPRLATWRDRIRDACGVTPTLAGSGATWFVDGRRDDALAALGDEGARIVVATTAAGADEAG